MILTSKLRQLGSWYVVGEISAKLDWSDVIFPAMNHKRRHPNGRQHVPYIGICPIATILEIPLGLTERVSLDIAFEKASQEAEL